MMKKISKYLPIIAIVLTPFIIFQWYLKLVWLRLDSDGPYFYIYLLAFVYLLAYALVYRENIIGYGLMWLVFLALFVTKGMLLGIKQRDWLLGIDLWFNIILSGNAVLKKIKKW